MDAEKVEVIICGGGSAGLTAAIWLARFGINFKILEQRPGPLEIGQADGVQCRTVEIFENLGISGDLLKESYHVMEVTFWSPNESGQLQRKYVAPDTKVGVSHQPHVILNQARMNDIMLEEIVRLRDDRSSGVLYNSQVESVRILKSAQNNPNETDYPVEVVSTLNGKACLYRAKYVIGCDGAHSTVRKSLGFNMIGDSSDSVWGVIDLFPITNFPDIRKKALINSKAGNLMIIPREGDELVRFYIELPGKTAKNTTEQTLRDKITSIFQPYKMEIASIMWWSAYVIGQRLADHFTKDFRIFLTGDSCHTHSPKAGQGMNVSLQDGFNIGWKMAHVVTGRAPPEVLETYVAERQETAEQLIDFDRSFTKFFSSDYRQKNGITTENFRDQFVKAGRYTAGMATKYSPSILTCPGNNDTAVASGLHVGMRFPSAPVVRLSDARPMQLNANLPADGRWHILVFCSRNKVPDVLNQVASQLHNTVQLFTPKEAAADNVICPTLVIKGERKSLELDDIPEFFFPKTGKHLLRNLHRVFVDDEDPNMLGCGLAFSTYGVDPDRGAIIIVRPDLYVAQMNTLENLKAAFLFFRGCLTHVG